MADPTRKEVESIQRRIDTVNRQLKPLSKSCVKKVKLLPGPGRDRNYSTYFHCIRYIDMLICSFLNWENQQNRRKNTKRSSRRTTRRARRRPYLSTG